MPGPVSDSYDPEWGTGYAAHNIREALKDVYRTVSGILDNQPPMDIRVLVHRATPLNRLIHSGQLTEWEWRIIRFALERAEESI
jgi:hypothetical protein